MARNKVNELKSKSVKECSTNLGAQQRLANFSRSQTTLYIPNSLSNLPVKRQKPWAYDILIQDYEYQAHGKENHNIPPSWQSYTADFTMN